MSEPFLAEIRIVGFNFAPRGWAFCDGQILPINQNQSLYSLLGPTYGGDGRTNFALPDMRGRTPIHADASHPEGQKSGEETHALSVAEVPTHTHVAGATSSLTSVSTTPTDNLLAPSSGMYHAPDAAAVTMRSDNLANTGASQAHQNMQPYLALNFCIALQGLFPPRN